MNISFLFIVGDFNYLLILIYRSTAAPLQRLESQYTSSTNPEIQNTLLQLPALHQKLNSICKFDEKSHLYRHTEMCSLLRSLMSLQKDT